MSVEQCANRSGELRSLSLGGSVAGKHRRRPVTRLLNTPEYGQKIVR